MKLPILGGTYTTRSLNLASDRCVNLYPELAPSPPAKEVGALYGTPGLVTKVTLPTGPVQYLKPADGSLFAAAGGKLYRINSDWSYTDLGWVGNVINMEDNGLQLCLSSGHFYTYSTNTLATITASGWPAGSVRFLDGYFLSNHPNTGQIQISGLYDANAWDPLDFATAEGNPDVVTAHITNQREWWVFGPASAEVYYNSGQADFPFSRVSGAFLETGIHAPKSLSKADNSVWWIGQDERGGKVAFRNSGYIPKRVSTHAVEYAWSQYSDISDAIGFFYQQEGHLFWFLTFPTANATWVYDVATDQWHERGEFKLGEYNRHRANCYAYAFNQHVLGDYENGAIYVFDLDTRTAADRWLRIFKSPTNEGKRITYDKLQIDLESGVNGDVMLRYSDDGGHTWSNQKTASMGVTGEYSARAMFRQLGQGRNRVFELTGSDTCKTAIFAAYADVRAAKS